MRVIHPTRMRRNTRRPRGNIIPITRAITRAPTRRRSPRPRMEPYPHRLGVVPKAGRRRGERERERKREMQTLTLARTQTWTWTWGGSGVVRCVERYARGAGWVCRWAVVILCVWLVVVVVWWQRQRRRRRGREWWWWWIGLWEGGSPQACILLIRLHISDRTSDRFVYRKINIQALLGLSMVPHPAKPPNGVEKKVVRAPSAVQVERGVRGGGGGR
jgi:hypothetical protein